MDTVGVVQVFEAAQVDMDVGAVQLRVDSNHGHNQFTCLYRLRVFGDLS